MLAFVASPHVYNMTPPCSGICRQPLWAKGFLSSHRFPAIHPSSSSIHPRHPSIHCQQCHVRHVHPTKTPIPGNGKHPPPTKLPANARKRERMRWKMRLESPEKGVARVEAPGKHRPPLFLWMSPATPTR